MYLSKKAKKDSYVSWIISLSAAGFFFFDFVQMGMMNTLKDDIVATLSIPEDSLGYYFTIPFSVGNWIWVFPAAILIDRFSVRQLTLSMLALSILGALGTALSPIPSLMILCRFASGTAHSFCFLCCTTLVNRWFSPSRKATVMGIAVALGVSGLLVAQLPLYYLTAWLGWRRALLANALVGILCWLLAFLFLADYPADVKLSGTKKTTLLQGFMTAITHGQAWLYSLYTACLNAPVPTIVFLYLNDFLMHVHEIQDKSFASAMSSLFLFGHIIGISSAGFVSDKWQSRQKPLILASLLSLFLFALFILYTPLSPLSIALLLFTFGLLLGAQVITYPAIAEMSNPTLIATSMSIASFVIMGSFPVWQTLTGWALKHAKGDAPIDYPSMYLYGFLPIFIALLTSLALSFIVRDTYKKGSNSQRKRKLSTT